MTDPALIAAGLVPSSSEREWAEMTPVAPRLVGTASRYLDQIGLSQRPATVVVADRALRLFCRYMVDHHPDTQGFAEVGRDHIEGFKGWLVAMTTAHGKPLAANTLRQRLGMLHSFFERIIEWDWPDAPARIPIFGADIPRSDDVLPRFLDDGDAVRLARAVAAEPDPLRRLVLELLTRTGMRVGELCALEADAVVHIGEGWWLRVPLGKLHDNRYVPLHPQLLPLLDAWRAEHPHPSLLLTNDGRPINRHVVTRMLNRVARRAGIGHVHPHQLRHTLATQAINRGMRLEAIAALLGHKSLRMTMRYARIANRTVADEYQAVTTKVEALYASSSTSLGADAEGPGMRRVRTEHHRMLANGWCTRPRELDCSFETMCESCGFFATTVEFRPTLQRQADHAAANDQPARAQLFKGLIDGLGKEAS